MENPANNSTAPSNPPYNWEAEPKRRGTFGIISLCFSTMIICVWSTLHFNIPIRRYTVARRFFLQVSWMIIALLAPEFLLYLAINERIMASVLLKKVLKFHPHLAKPGKFTCLYNWIRGTFIRMYKWTRGRAESKERHYEPTEQTPQPHFGIVHAFYAVMGGFAFYGPFNDNTPKSLFEISTNPRSNVEVAEFEALVYIMEHFPHVIINITEDYILDRAASSSLGKALLIVQVVWFCTNCTSRLSQGLPLSLLEVSTAAHALCTLLTYVVWWSKPINVATPTLLRDKEAREVYALLKCSDYEYKQALEMAQKREAGDILMPTGPHISEKIVLAVGALQHLPNPKQPPESCSSSFKDRDRVLFPGDISGQAGTFYSIVVSVAISPILYGLVHFLAWSDQFPTPLERRLWLASSFVVSCSGFVGVFVTLPWARLKVTYDRISRTPGFLSQVAMVFQLVVITMITMVMWLIIILAHVLASGFLIVESVRQLYFLNDAAYQLPSWSTWPHFS